MNLKLDENLSRHLKKELSTAGHDVLTAADEKLLSQPDEVIAAAAKQEGRILFTLDLDLADITQYPPGTHPGIVLFRPASLGPLEVNRRVVELAAARDLNDLVGCLVVVEPTRVRVRRPEAGPPNRPNET
jgi:predicted nuclease of predicted toxin-antitoxin system